MEGHERQLMFDWVDYLVFGVMLLSSAFIGVYFAFFAKQKQNTISEYLMGGKTMGVFPISMSLIASTISGVALLGFPAEMYIFGTQYWMTVVSMVLVGITMTTVFLPVFYTLQITSSYEYLKLRFNLTVRILASIIFIIKMVLYIPLIIYVPALAFNQVTGVNLHLISLIVCVVCIFYTTLGGLKAVVWTDTLQTLLMIGAIVIVMVLGTLRVGGVALVFEHARRTDRLEFFNFDPDPRVRHTFWSVVVGNYVNWLAWCTVDQAVVQRYLAMPSLRMANFAMLGFGVGMLLVMSVNCFTGLVIFAMYHDCDPISTQSIGKGDQLLPYFVMEVAKAVPGLPGLFVAGIFSAALSSMSTSLNSMAGVIFEDLIRPSIKPMTESRAAKVIKILVAFIGLVCVGLVFLVEHMGTLMQVVNSLSGITAGSLLGIFALGMLFPWANAKGALVGGLASFALLAWISLGTQAAVVRGDIVFPRKAVSIEGCPADLLNRTLNHAHATERSQPEPVFALYQMSYLWYTLLGTVTTILVGLLVSFITGPRDPRLVDRDLLVPAIHRFLPAKSGKEDAELVSLKKIDTTDD